MLLARKEGAWICTSTEPTGLALVRLGTGTGGLNPHQSLSVPCCASSAPATVTSSGTTSSGPSLFERVSIRTMFPIPRDFKCYLRTKPLIYHHWKSGVGHQGKFCLATWPGYGAHSHGSGEGGVPGWEQAGLTQMSVLQKQDSGHHSSITWNLNI